MSRSRTSSPRVVTFELYSGDLIAKYLERGEHLDRMPVWVFLETIEFRLFTDFYLFCAERWEDADMLQRHYLLKSVKALRNACAHNSCVLNGVGGASERSDWGTNKLMADSLNANGVKRTRTRRDKLSNLRIAQMAETLYADSLFCTRPHTARRHADMLEKLRADWKRSRGMLGKNPAITSFFEFFFKLVDIWERPEYVNARCKTFGFVGAEPPSGSAPVFCRTFSPHAPNPLNQLQVVEPNGFWDRFTKVLLPYFFESGRSFSAAGLLTGSTKRVHVCRSRTAAHETRSCLWLLGGKSEIRRVASTDNAAFRKIQNVGLQTT